MVLIESLGLIDGLDALKLRAGIGGSKNAIRWPYIAENTDIENWTKGGELIFITGLNWNWTVLDFIKLIKKAKIQYCSGLVILTQSPYLDAIPIEVLDYADKLDFPLFEQPFSLPMVNITEILSNAIIMDGLNNKSSRWLLQNLAENLSISEIELIKAKEIGFTPNQPLSIAFLKLDYIVGNDLTKADYLISQFMIDKGVQLPITELYNGWLVIKPTLSDKYEDSMKFWKKLHLHLLESGYDCTVGVSDALELNVLYKAVSQARKSAEFYRHNNRNEVVHYNSLGIAQLFTHIGNDEINSFCSQHLGDIFGKSDSRNNALKATLICYFDNLCSMRQTALVLNIHRNTLSNRLNKIEYLTGVNLNNAQQRLSLQIALIAEQFFS